MKGVGKLKIKLEVSNEKYKETERLLIEAGFELDDDAEFVLTQRGHYSDFLSGKKDEASCHIPVGEIVYIESMGHDIIIHTADAAYRCGERLWQLEKSLNPSEFLRISNSVFIAKKHIKRIKSALSQKFIVTLSDGSTVDVTRSYYYIFKNVFGI